MQLDWTTFILEIVNFLVLLWILKRFFFRPVREAIARRHVLQVYIGTGAAARALVRLGGFAGRRLRAAFHGVAGHAIAARCKPMPPGG